jgi:SAM-dependent methyltransferase
MAEINLQKQTLFDDFLATLKLHNPVCLSGTILDFGCGPDGYVTSYKPFFRKAFAVDVQNYRKRYDNDIDFVLSDGKSIDLPDQATNLIVSHSVLEHIDDLTTTFKELNRVSRVGGSFYLTVSPLYYSPTGAHLHELKPWGHLRDDAGEAFMTTQPIKRTGSGLNRMTIARLMTEVSKVPWQILHFETRMVKQEPPATLVEKWPLFDLMTREFRLIAKRRC